MNENFNENIVESDFFNTDFVAGSDDLATYNDTSVSSGDAGNTFTNSVVGVSNVGTTNVVAATTGDTETGTVLAEDIIPHLEKIEYNQTALIFIILFIWCERKVKNAVRGFTGRGLDE